MVKRPTNPSRLHHPVFIPTAGKRLTYKYYLTSYKSQALCRWHATVWFVIRRHFNGPTEFDGAFGIPIHSGSVATFGDAVMSFRTKINIFIFTLRPLLRRRLALRLQSDLPEVDMSDCVPNKIPLAGIIFFRAFICPNHVNKLLIV